MTRERNGVRPERGARATGGGGNGGAGMPSGVGGGSLGIRTPSGLLQRLLWAEILGPPLSRRFRRSLR
jgi:hypothetical protein